MSANAGRRDALNEQRRIRPSARPKRWLFAICIALMGCVGARSTGGRVRIDGSNGVIPLATALAAEHQRSSPVVLEIGKGLGSAERMQAVEDGRIDIALASHGIDRAALSRRGLSVHEFAKSAVVFGVHESVGLTAITSAQVCDIFSGRLTNWQALGGSDLPIVARTRATSEVDVEVIRERVGCFQGLTMPPAVLVLASTGEMARELAALRGGIGVTTSTIAEQSGGRIKALALDGIAPTTENVARGAYTLVRSSYFVTRSTTTDAVRAFMAFAKSETGAKVVLANGAVPVR